MPRPDRVDASPDTSTEAGGARPRAYVLAGQRVLAGPLAPGLHVVATPIGTLADITIRALETLAGADLVLCEDTRVTRKLTSHYGISTALAAYHEHNAALRFNTAREDRWKIQWKTPPFRLQFLRLNSFNAFKQLSLFITPGLRLH